MKNPGLRPLQGEARSLIGLAIPIVVSQLAIIALGVIDTIMAGRLSAVDLAAIAAGRSLYMPLFISVLGVLLAVSPIIAQWYGKGDYHQIGLTFWKGLLLSQMLVLPSFFLMRNAHLLMVLLDIDPQIIPITQGYLDAISWSLPPAFAYQVLRFMNEGISVSRPNMYLTFCAIPVNYVANLALMYGKWGFPKLGAVGAGWATTTVWYLLFTGFSIFMMRHPRYREFKLSQVKMTWNWPVLKDILTVGVPNGVSFGMEVSMFAAVALLIGSMGVYELASHQIALNIASVAFMIPLGIGMATTARVGLYVGKGEEQMVRFAGRTGILLATGSMTITAATMWLFPDFLISIYTTDPKVITLAIQLLFMAAIFQISDGLQVGAAGALRGLKDTRIPMIVNTFAYWVVGLPTGYWLGISGGYGPQGMWAGLVSGLTFAAIAHTSRFFIKTRIPATKPAAALRR